MNLIKTNLIQIYKKIRKYSDIAKRNPKEIQLIAISKSRSIANIKELVLAGQTAFGENYIQEFLSKIKILNQNNIEWHFIGKIQSNKIRFIAKHFSWCHSVENIAAAIKLNKKRSDQNSLLNILIQININKTSNKQGILNDKLLELVENVLKLPNLQLRGIMGFPNFTTNYEEQLNNNFKIASIFNNLKKNYKNIDTLSLGTSDDMKSAIISGSTMLRIGNLFFRKK